MDVCSLQAELSAARHAQQQEQRMRNLAAEEQAAHRQRELHSRRKQVHYASRSPCVMKGLTPQMNGLTPLL